MTAQIPDRIIIKGQELKLFTNPLEQYWAIRRKKRPAFCTSLECLRGYVATWEIIETELYLNKIEGQIKRTIFLFGSRIINCSLKTIFPRSKHSPVQAQWFSGKLRIPEGNMIRFRDSDYDSRFERDTIITMQEGKLIRCVTLNHAEHTLTGDNIDKTTM